MWPPCRGRIVNQQESSWAAISFSDSPPPPPPRTPLLLLRLLPSHPLPSHPPSSLYSLKVFCGALRTPRAHTHTHTITHTCTFTHVHSPSSYRPYHGMLCVAFTPSLPLPTPFPSYPPPHPFWPLPSLPTLHRSQYQGLSTRSSEEFKKASRRGRHRRIGGRGMDG